MIDLDYLGKLIDDTNAELLAGASSPFHMMTTEEQEAFVVKMEKLYKNCITIRLQRSLKTFRTGVNFEDYKIQEVQKREKKKAQAEKLADGKKKKAEKSAPAIAPDMLANVIAMAGGCVTCLKMKADCTCPKVEVKVG